MQQAYPSGGPLIVSPILSPWTQAVTAGPPSAIGGIPSIFGSSLNILGPSKPIGNNVYVTPVVATPFSASPNSILVQTIEEMGNQQTPLPPKSAHSSASWPFAGVPPWMAMGFHTSPRTGKTPAAAPESEPQFSESVAASEKTASKKPLLSATVTIGVSPLFPQHSMTPKFVAYGLDQNFSQSNDQLWTPISYFNFQQMLNDDPTLCPSPSELLVHPKKEEQDKEEQQHHHHHHHQHGTKTASEDHIKPDERSSSSHQPASLPIEQVETTVKLTDPPKVIPRRGRPAKRVKTSSQTSIPKAKRVKSRMTGSTGETPKSADLIDPELAKIFYPDTAETQVSKPSTTKIKAVTSTVKLRHASRGFNSRPKRAPREDRYWLDQQASYMADLKSKGFEAIQIPGNRYKCSLCSQIFDTKLLCIRHAVEHLSYKPFRCLDCGAEFTRCDTLQRHLKGRCPAQKLDC